MRLEGSAVCCEGSRMGNYCGLSEVSSHHADVTTASSSWISWFGWRKGRDFEWRGWCDRLGRCREGGVSDRNWSRMECRSAYVNDGCVKHG